jgi:hypothetical protein
MGAGTINLSLNLLNAERAIIGQLATENDESIGHFLRRHLIRSLEKENPAAARRLIEVRRQRRAAALLVVGMLAVAASFAPDSRMDLRRPSTTRSIARVLRVNRTEVA